MAHTQARSVSSQEILIVNIEKPKETAPYSVYGVAQRRLIVLSASLAAFFSPLSANVYYPALELIAHDLHTTNSKINLTVTMYLIIQGVAPIFAACISDTVGRRPAYGLCFTIFLAANLGLALQNNYAALMVLRCMQSAGSSGLTTLASSVVSDIITPQERGNYLAFTSIGSVLGLTLSPLIGGLITQYLDWHWIFWFLFIFTAAFCTPFFLFFPETCRNVVGNGSIFPPPENRCLTDYLRRRKQTQAGVETDVRPTTPKKAVIFSPISALEVFTSKEAALILVPSGIVVGVLYAVVTSLSSTFNSIYALDQLRISLIFLPLGAGSIISSFTMNKLLNYNFQRHVRKLGVIAPRNRHDDLSNFPVEKARLQVGLPLLCLGLISAVLYGWTLQFGYNIAALIILLLLISWTFTSFLQVTSALAVDIYPGRAASVSAAMNLIRCEIGALAAGIISPATQGIGFGWAYTSLAIIGLATMPVLLWVMASGMTWRGRAREKEMEVRIHVAEVVKVRVSGDSC